MRRTDVRSWTSHRFTMLSVDSQYCNLDEFGAAVETLGTAQYCTSFEHSQLTQQDHSIA